MLTSRCVWWKKKSNTSCKPNSSFCSPSVNLFSSCLILHWLMFVGASVSNSKTMRWFKSNISYSTYKIDDEEEDEANNNEMKKIEYQDRTCTRCEPGMKYFFWCWTQVHMLAFVFGACLLFQSFDARERERDLEFRCNVMRLPLFPAHFLSAYVVVGDVIHPVKASRSDFHIEIVNTNKWRRRRRRCRRWWLLLLFGTESNIIYSNENTFFPLHISIEIYCCLLSNLCS